MHYIAIDIGGTTIKHSLVSVDGNVLDIKETDSEAYKGAELLINKVKKIIEDYIKVNEKSIMGIAISTAGQVNSKSGEIIFATETIPGWSGVKLKKIIEEEFNYNCTVENDVNCAALGELWKGAGIKGKSFLCITIGTGIGGAIVINNEIFTGSGFSAGEFGHINLYPNGDKCTCGSCGCYEVYASTTALVKGAKSIFNNSNENINGKIIFERAKSGEEKYLNIIDNWIFNIALGLKSLVNIFNPNLIVIGGGVAEQGEVLTNKISEKLNPMLMKSFKRNLNIKPAQCGNKAGILGAVYFHKKKYAELEQSNKILGEL